MWYCRWGYFCRDRLTKNMFVVCTKISLIFGGYFFTVWKVKIRDFRSFCGYSSLNIRTKTVPLNTELNISITAHHVVPSTQSFIVLQCPFNSIFYVPFIVLHFPFISLFYCVFCCAARNCSCAFASDQHGADSDFVLTHWAGKFRLRAY